MEKGIQKNLTELDQAWKDWWKGNISAEEFKIAIRKIDSEIKETRRAK